jgi:hypothetical protein
MTRALTLVGYVVIAVAALLQEVRARRTGRATAEDALAVVLRSQVGRPLLLAAWLWLGWHLFARAGER